MELLEHGNKRLHAMGHESHAKVVKLFPGKLTLVPVEIPTIALELLEHDLQIFLVDLQGGRKEEDVVHEIDDLRAYPMLDTLHCRPQRP